MYVPKDRSLQLADKKIIKNRKIWNKNKCMWKTDYTHIFVSRYLQNSLVLKLEIWYIDYSWTKPTKLLVNIILSVWFRLIHKKTINRSYDFSGIALDIVLVEFCCDIFWIWIVVCFSHQLISNRILMIFANEIDDREYVYT